MIDKETEIRKVCGFFVNDWHLTTMILPYIRNEIEAKNKIITVLQNSMKSNIEEILSKMNLNEILENKILEIDWTKTFPVKYSIMKQKLKEINGQVENINILISGDNSFIKMVNQNIEKIVKKTDIKNYITMINFYDVTQFTNVSEITAKHQYILNTSGIRRIEEVFEKENKKNA